MLDCTCIKQSGPTAVPQEEGVIELTWQAISGMSSTPALVSTMDDQAVMADTWRSSSQSHGIVTSEDRGEDQAVALRMN